MQDNIFQVINENHLDEILNDHPQNLVVIMYSSKNCGHSKTIKPKFTNLSKTQNDCFYIYIDLTNFTKTTNKYFAGFEFTPTFLFYFGGKKIAFIEGAHEQSLLNTITFLKKKIDEKRKVMLLKVEILDKEKIEEINNININLTNDVITNSQDNFLKDTGAEIVKKKMDLLNKLRLLVQNDIKLSKNFNLESDYDDMLFEVEFHTNPQFRQQIMIETKKLQQNQLSKQNEKILDPVHNLNEPENSSKKQDQIRQLQELSIIDQRMQMQNWQKLQQLKQIQKMKEQQEKNQNNPNNKKDTEI
jgi:thiol-disulfide isomerase/thioredoxin